MTPDEAPPGKAEALSVLPYQTPTTPNWTVAVKIIAGIGLLLGLGRLCGTSMVWWRMVHQPRQVGLYGLIYFVWILTSVILVVTSLTAASRRPRGRRWLMFGESVYAALYVLVSVINIAQVSGAPPPGWGYVLTTVAWRTSAEVGYSVLAVFLLAQPGARAVFRPSPTDA